VANPIPAGTIQNPARGPAPRHAAANVLIHVAFAVTGIVTVLLGPILPVLITRWSLSDEGAGFFFATQFCGQLTGSLSTGFLIPIHRFGYRLTFATGFALVALGVAALSVGTERLGLPGTAIYGYGLGLVLSAGNLWVAEIFPMKRAIAVSVLNVTWTAGAIACGPLVMLAERTHLLAAFLVVVAAFMAVCALLIAVWEIEPHEDSVDAKLPGQTRDDEILERRPETGRVQRAPSQKFAGPTAIALASFFFFYVGTETAMGGWVAAYANRVEAMSAMMSALTPAFFWSGLLTGRALAPVFLRAIAEKILVAAGLVLATLSIGGVLYSTTYRTAVLCAVSAGLGLACVYPILVGWMVKIYGAQARRFGSILFACGGMGGATLPWLVGLVSTHDGGLRAGLVVPMAACVAMVLVNGFFPKRSATFSA
jgi:MFS transporter, FHS family, glucose/mannose:H+ symporter